MSITNSSNWKTITICSLDLESVGVWVDVGKMGKCKSHVTKIQNRTIMAFT